MNNYRRLLSKFMRIKNAGWIKTRRNGATGIGYTFEYLIGKKADFSFNPDFMDIEIKTMRQYSKQTIHLFCLSPEGENGEYPMKKLISKLGYNSKNKANTKYLKVGMNAVEFSNVGYYEKLKIVINKEEKRLELMAVKSNHKVNLEAYWPFEKIESRLKTKLSKLALVIAKNKFIDNEEHFYYYKIIFYKLRSFKVFLELLEKGIIKIRFNIEGELNGDEITSVCDRGTSFLIDKINLEALFERVL